MKLQSLGIQFTEDCVQVLDPSTGETIAELDFDAAEALAKFMLEECEAVKRRRLH